MRDKRCHCERSAESGLAVQWTLMAALTFIAALPTGAAGQSSDDQKSPPEKRPLIDRQEDVQKSLDRLEQRMQRLAKLLAEDEPEKAEKLRDALEQSRERRIDRRLTELVTLLKTLQYGDAEQQQESVLSDLENVAGSRCSWGCRAR